jgi:hypothetical protein
LIVLRSAWLICQLQACGDALGRGEQAIGDGTRRTDADTTHDATRRDATRKIISNDLNQIAVSRHSRPVANKNRSH